MKSIQFLFFIIILSCFFGCKSQSAAQSASESVSQTASPSTAKNVIFLIGDGMGLTQTSAGYYRNNMHLELERAHVVGLSKTNASDNLITDSAAGATAFSIGEKTYNGAIGVDKNKTPKETILEKLSKDGFSTGLIATCAITHATPASFYAHQPSRKMGYEIAADMVQSPLDAFIGGGKKHFYNRTDGQEGQTDDRNILEELTNKGFSFASSLEEFSENNGKTGFFIAEGHPESILKGRGDILPKSIKPMISKLQQLSDTGFFLMVEGSQIDWGGHANDSEYIITEMIDFDQAVGAAFDFAQQDGNTLVIITADHETGGYALRGKDSNYNEIEGSFTTLGHSATMVPVYAFGPGAEHFQGIYNNNQIYFKILESLGR